MVDAATGVQLGLLGRRHADGFFEQLLHIPTLPALPGYRLQVQWDDGQAGVIDDPYPFGPVLGEMDVWLLGAPPQLGKSWFLYLLSERVKLTVPSWPRTT